MTHRAILLALSVVLTWALGVAACDSGGGTAETGEVTPTSGTVTLSVGQGVEFLSGTVSDPGGFNNSDLWTAENGDSIQLFTGGETIIKVRPVNWFKTAGGVNSTFDSLADVPDELPGDDYGLPLQKAKTGNGFVMLSAHDGYTKGWIEEASATSLTVVFEPVGE